MFALGMLALLTMWLLRPLFKEAERRMKGKVMSGFHALRCRRFILFLALRKLTLVSQRVSVAHAERVCCETHTP